MILQARTVVTMDGPPLVDGAVLVDGSRIAAVGTLAEMRAIKDEPVLDLGEQVLMPGLINAHCHLDYTMLRRAIVPPASFTAWVQRLNAIKRTLDNDDYLAAIGRGFQELAKWGTTTVCNIAAFPELMPRLPPVPIRTWWFYEMIDIRHRHTTEEVVAGALMFFHERPDMIGGYGLNPHAPYTASTTLYRMANTCAGNLEMALTTHVAESREELAMFRDASGPLYDFMGSLRRPMHDCGRRPPFAQLWESGAINADWLLAHMNELTEDDFTILAQLPAGGMPHVVHCPGSHRYFRHTPFPFRRLHELGVNVCVGTDSLASTDSLSLLGELRELRTVEPWLSAEELLRTVTLHPARALRREHQLGCIAPGALADLIAFPVNGTVGEIHEEIVAYHRPIPWMMIDGQICA